MVNKAIIVGRLGADPEVMQTAGGASVAKLSVATSEKWTDKSGQKVEKTEWHRVTAWGKLAEIIGQYARKGNLVYVEGKIQTQKYTAKDGTEKFSTEINASSIRLLGGKQEESQSPGVSLPADADTSDIPF